MAKFIWGAVCRRIIVDATTNLVSYIDLLESARPQGYPIVFPSMFVGTLFERTDEEPSIEVRVSLIEAGMAASDSPIAVKSGEVKLEPHHRRGRVHLVLNDPTFQKPGRYEIVVEQRGGKSWVEAARYPFDMLESVGEAPLQKPKETKATGKK